MHVPLKSQTELPALLQACQEKHKSVACPQVHRGADKVRVRNYLEKAKYRGLICTDLESELTLSSTLSMFQESHFGLTLAWSSFSCTALGSVLLECIFQAVSLGEVQVLLQLCTQTSSGQEHCAYLV